MAEPTLSRHAVRAGAVLPRPADVVWPLVTDVRNHARWIPMTRIDAPAHLGPGGRFVAVSGPGATHGRPGLADRMTLVSHEDPRPAHGPRVATTGRAVYRKTGPVLLGTAEVHVRPLGPGHCEVTWVEDVHLRGPDVGAWRHLTGTVLGVALAGMLRLALRRLRRELG